MALFEQGYSFVAGLDEAGRGCLAGPVVAAAVILPLDDNDLLTRFADVRDSKQITAAVRECQFEVITQHAVAVSELDRAAKKGVIHRNNAARRKSRLMKQLNATR